MFFFGLFYFLRIIHAGNIKHQSDYSPNGNSNINQHFSSVSQSLFLRKRIMPFSNTVESPFIKDHIEYYQTG